MKLFFGGVQTRSNYQVFVYIYMYYFYYIRILGRDFLTDSTIISSWSSSEISLGKLQVYNEASAESHGFLLRFFMGGQGSVSGEGDSTLSYIVFKTS